MQVTSKRVAQNTSLVLLGRIVVLLSNFIVNIWFARYLGKSGYGMFSFAIAYVSFFALLADFGMQFILVREMSKDPDRASAFFSAVFIIKLTLSAISILLAIGSAFIFNFDTDLFTIIIIHAFNIVFSVRFNTFRITFEAPFSSTLNMKTPVISHFLDSGALVLLMGIAYLLIADIRILVSFYVFANIPGFLFITQKALKNVALSFRFNKILSQFFLKESLPLWLFSATLVVYSNTEIVILKWLHTNEEVGLYAAAFRLIAPLSFVPRSIMMSFFPVFANFFNNDKDRFHPSYLLAAKIMLICAILLVIFSISFGELIFKTLYTAEFYPASSAFIILALSQAIFFLIIFFTSTFSAINKQHWNIYFGLVLMTVEIIMSFLLIPVYGAFGAAFAKFSATAVALIAIIILVYRNKKLSIQGIVRTQFLWISSATGVFVSLLYISDFPGWTIGLSLILGIPFFTWGLFKKEELIRFAKILKIKKE